MPVSFHRAGEGGPNPSKFGPFAGFPPETKCLLVHSRGIFTQALSGDGIMELRRTRGTVLPSPRGEGRISILRRL